MSTIVNPYFSNNSIDWKEFETNDEKFYEHGAGAFYWQDVYQSDKSTKKQCNVALPSHQWTGQDDIDHLLYWSLPIAPPASLESPE